MANKPVFIRPIGESIERLRNELDKMVETNNKPLTGDDNQIRYSQPFIDLTKVVLELYDQNSEPIVDLNDGRYPMCADQPVQLDCRDISCKYHKEGACTNVSPAITLNTDGKKRNYVCWTKLSENG